LKADFYPQVSIAGDIGYRGIGIDNSFRDFSSLVWSFGPKVYLPIFNLSSIKANYKIADIKVNKFIANYNKTINDSIQDINTKLSGAKISKINFMNLDTIEKNEEHSDQIDLINSLGGVYKNEKQIIKEKI